MDNMDISRNWRILYGVASFADSEHSGAPNSFSTHAHQLVIATNYQASLPQPGAGGPGSQNQVDVSNYGTIGWCNLQGAASTAAIVIDPMHVITHDLFVQAWAYDGGNPSGLEAGLNYMLVLEALDGEKIGLMGVVRQRDATNASY